MFSPAMTSLDQKREGKKGRMTHHASSTTQRWTRTGEELTIQHHDGAGGHTTRRTGGVRARGQDTDKREAEDGQAARDQPFDSSSCQRSYDSRIAFLEYRMASRTGLPPDSHRPFFVQGIVESTTSYRRINQPPGQQSLRLG